ncbi:MAG: PAS domain S-box protein [Melioribacteraceae bacterium]|jgi:PAS domain S-box-containing protein|nr:PAS domain S-box protein [Melioribacteraceae bacterium]
MKKLLIELLRKYLNEIIESWVARLIPTMSRKMSEHQASTFVQNSLSTFIEVIESGDYKIADQYLIDIYNLFSTANLNLLEISQLFSHGRFAILNFIEKEASTENDPVILLGFFDDLIEQIYARYGVLHQETKMKELIVDRDRLASKLELNQQYLKSILKDSDSAIMVVDKNEQFIAWNKGAERLFGYTEEEVLGRSSTLLLPDDVKYLNELNWIQNEVMRNDQIKIVDTERKTKKGEILSVRLNVNKLPDINNEYAGRSIIIKDYTEYKRLQAQIDQSEKLAVIGQLAAGVAHEIGNPLTAISSLVQILQRRSKDEFMTEQLVMIKENIDRISKIVRELVDFSRPPSYETKSHDITSIIKTALGIVKYDKRVRKVNFETNLESELPFVTVAADQLLQVFVNILFNALDAVDGEGTITVKSYHHEEKVLVDITDNGCGMDETVLSKIFDPFFTTKEVGKGTGLGLSVSYGIIKKFGGEITVTSKLNEGSTFSVMLPGIY